MPIALDRSAWPLVRTVMSGEVTDEELLAHYQQPFFLEFSGVWRELVDGRAITTYSISSEGQQRLAVFARMHTDKLKGGRVAMVAATEVAFGMFRMWQLQREGLGYDVRVFRDADEALAWLAEPARG